MHKLTQSRLKQLLKYAPDTGEFVWSVARKGVRVGHSCGRISRWGYREICVDYVLHRANRLAFLYMTGAWPLGDVDHINKDKADDRWLNLRDVTHSQNMMNVGIKKTNTTGFTGVVWDVGRGKWRAQIRINGIKKNLGRFISKRDAVVAYNNAAIAAHGEFAILNDLTGIED